MSRHVVRFAGVLALGLTLSGLLAAAAWGEDPFDYFANSWNVIGLKDYQRGTRITPDNKLLLADGAKAEFFFGRDLTPLGRKHVKRAMKGWMPLFLVNADDGPVRYEFTFWATPLPTVKDWRKAFDWPTEGENFLNWVTVKATNTGTIATEAKVRMEEGGRSAKAASSHSASVAPGACAEFVLRFPFSSFKDTTPLAKEDPKVWLARTVDYWEGVMRDAARIQVPCQKATEALLAAHVCQLIANDRGELHGGEGFYDHFYIRDGAYQIMELEEAGLADAAVKAVAFYLKAQRPDGRFETQKNQFDANGQALWVLWQYHKISGDRPWLQRAYPQMRKAVEWIKQARRQTRADSPYAGLLPVAPADGEYLWDGKHHIVGYDLWNLRGILCTADAATILGKAEAKGLLQEADSYRAAIDAACRRSGVAHFPPSWEKEGTHWGNTETLWPTELFASNDPRVTATIHHARKVHGGGFIEGTIQWLGMPDAIHPYMSAYTSMASLARGEDEQVVEDFYWYLLHSTAAHAFPEGIFYKRRFAWSDTIPHVTGASNYTVMLRHMLVHERGDQLDLLAAVPDAWLADGREIRVERAPTHFGVMSLVVRGKPAGVEVQLAAPERNPPRRIVLHLPKSRPLVGQLAGVEVVSRRDQKTRWDFDRVVKLYQQQAKSYIKTIPGLVTLPARPRIPFERCRFLDLRPVANTDPFQAPFGVPKPDKFLFTGMPVGETAAGGVPFDILDPAKTGGRGFVVLHSPRAPKNIAWPRLVEIPVGQQGKRLFFLGNVHGWASHDPGVGPWGAVAEYVIHYSDGKQQTVPWITGQTADEWAAPPRASDVLAGLQGSPWHLNVLGVEVRPVPIEKIVFRDLNTPAAPLLAAVTLEQ